MTRKSLLGRKVRRLRQERGLTQAQMAARLGISPSYFNLIEHNERPLTVPLLLKLSQAFGIDLAEFSDDEERRLTTALREVFADGSLHAHEVKADELREIAGHANVARAIIELYRAYKSAREDAQAMLLGVSGGSGRIGAKRLLLPTEEARDFFHDRTNHFPTLEEAADALWRDAGLDPADLSPGLVQRLRRHGIAVEIASHDGMAGALRRFDPRAKRLTLSEVLPRSSRNFQIAYQLGLIEAANVLDALLKDAELSSRETETLCRVGLANYFAGAVLMPYAPFLAAARETRYDIELLTHRFGVGFEQACHRLATLQRPGAKGVPFYLVRVDIAGNIAKRFSAAGFHFSRFGGSCPRWNVHEAFTTPGRIRTQIARLPDGATFFCVARTVTKGGGGFHEPESRHAIGIGCEIAHARELVYADGHDLQNLDAATEIGVGCRLCERANCRQRAFPPLQHRLMVDEKVRGVSAYAFAPEG